MKKAAMQNLVLGQVSTNCILIKNKDTKEILIVDPADGAATISQAVTGMDGNPVAILLTHGHFDHIGAVDELRAIYDGILVYANEKEKELLEDSTLNLSGMWTRPFAVKADVFLKDDQVFTAAGFTIKMMHTPGHTKGSCCYYIEEEGILLSGDTLFHGSCGRMDFPTGSATDMQESLKRLFRELPEETEVFPGHDSSTSIAYEKRYNPFV